MVAFQAAGWFEVKGIGWEAAVALDRDCEDFAHLVNRRVAIDGRSYVCVKVNHFAHPPPYRKGERIGLVVTARQASITGSPA